MPPRAERALLGGLHARCGIPLSFVLLALWCVVAVPAFGVDDTGNGADAAVVAEIDSLLKEPQLKGGFQGIIIQSLRDGKVWYERNADLLFIPASNEKLLTSAAALNALGPDWRYRTTLLRVSEVDSEGVLRGDLILKGSGDPVLTDGDLDELIRSVRSSGIRRVAGRVIGDGARFDDQVYGDGWSWDDMPYYYSAQVSGLNLNGNLITITPGPARQEGERIHLTVSPTSNYCKIRNRARTAAKGAKSELIAGRELGKNVVTLDGAVALDAKPEDHRPFGVTVEDPPRYAAVVMAEKLRRSGIRVDGSAASGRASSGAVEVAAHVGQPLSELLKRLNKPSDNLVAECLLKTLGAEKGKGGAFAAGREVALAWFRQIGMDPAGVAMTDGSGLSRQTMVTPRNLAVLLRAMWSHPNSKVFIDSLPIAGVDGTLRNRMKGTPAESNCRAKTGYVSGASSISGYVTTKDGEPLLFVMLMNNHTCRNAVPMGVQNRIVVYLASYKR